MSVRETPGAGRVDRPADPHGAEQPMRSGPPDSPEARAAAVRVGALASCLLLVCWLALDSSPEKARREAIAAALRQGTIGGLSAAESAKLMRTITWLAAAAGVPDKIALNQPLETGGGPASTLTFYTSTPEAYKITGCSRGNAIYDGPLNAVFLDASLLKPREWLLPDPGITINYADLPFLDTYLQFVVLHELGHRLHDRRTPGLLDAGSTAQSRDARQREERADRFAVTQIRTAYGSAAAHGISTSSLNLGNLIGLQPEDYGDVERPTVALLAMARVMPLGMLLGLSPYSVFYTDQAHPTYVDRSLALVHQVLTDRNLRPALRYRAALVERTLAALKKCAEARLVEVTSRERLDDVAFATDRLAVASLAEGPITYVGFDRLRPAASGVRFISLGPGSGWQPPADASGSKGMWASMHGGILRFPARGGIEVAAGFAWRASPDAWRVRDRFVETVAPPQPSSQAVARTYGSLVSAVEGRVRQTQPLAELERQAMAAGAPPGSELALASLAILRGKGYAPILVTPDSSFYGFATIDLDRLAVTAVTAVPAPPQLKPRNRGSFVFVDGASQPRLLAVTVLATPPAASAPQAAWQPPTLPAPVRWEVWCLHPGPPERLASYPFLAQEVWQSPADRGLQEAFAPSLSEWTRSVTWLPPDSIVIRWENEAVYLVNLVTHRVSTVLPMAPEGLKVRVGSNGLVVLLVPGTYRLHVFHRDRLQPASWFRGLLEAVFPSQS